MKKKFRVLFEFFVFVAAVAIAVYCGLQLLNIFIYGQDF